MKRFAVIGGAGFVGRHVVKRLLDAGAAVTTLDLRAPSALWPGEDLLAVNLLAPGEIERAARSLGPVDTVVWLAASIRHRLGVDATALEDLALMVDAPLRLLRALDPAPASLINMSSVQVYGRPGKLPIDEDHPTEPFTAYGVAKLYAERALDIAGARRGTAVASLRVAFIYGPGQHAANVLPRFLEGARRGQAPLVHGSGSEVRDDVYVGDVARAVELAATRRARGAFNIATGRPHTLLDVARAVCELGPPGMEPRHDDAPSGWVDRWYHEGRAREAFGFVADTPFRDGVRAMWDAEGAR